MKTYKKRINLLKLVREPQTIPSVQIKSSEDIYEYIFKYDQFPGIEVYESFYTMNLNRANNTMAFTMISQGGFSGTVADPKLIAKYAIGDGASSVILVHNHPTGNLQPSDNDIQLTKTIFKGLELLEVNVLDHLIISNDGYFSFADEGLI